MSISASTLKYFHLQQINDIMIRLWLFRHRAWLPPVLESSEKSWNLKRVLESPGILLKFWKSQKRVLEFFLWSNSPEERFLSKHQHFFGLPLYVECSSSLTNCCDFHLGYIECNNVYLFSAHDWVTIFKFTIKSLILELRNCMSNPSTTVFCLIHHHLGYVNT